ncbi:unnamed protein product [Paramecium sonneborni]|uniref:Uncharacterized protein n=1 Tax=Paramecium sonneborni TaxID=65129 RepID=A0A8S1P4T9_9CILI|nr:unnamed protein product [Paramecium sonneborni]
MNFNIEIFDFYYQNYFKDISKIEYIEHVPDEILIDMDDKENKKKLIKIEECTLGISVSAVSLLYPICIEFMKTEQYQDQASWMILFMNGENYSAWGIRQRLKKEEDLKLTELICIRFPGSSCSFNYRQQFQTSYENETRFFLKAFKKKNRSYHLWTYRMKYIKKIALDDFSVYEKECYLMKNLAQKDVHNFSIFHHLMICSKQCGMELMNWALELRDSFTLMYQGQTKDCEIDFKALQSLNYFLIQIYNIMRLIVQQYYGFGQKKTFKIELNDKDTSDQLISVIASKVGRQAQDLVIKCKRDQYSIKIIEGWPIEFYEFQENQNILVEVRENESDTKQKEQKRQTEKYLNKLFQNQREKPQKLSAVSETSENSDDEGNQSKQKSSNTDVEPIQSDFDDKIFQTVKSGNLEMLQQLSQKIDSQLLNQASFGGWNPIHFATFLEYKLIVEFLISKDVDINKVTDEGWTPLQIAVHRHNIEIVKVILNHSQVDVNLITDKGIALNLACKSNQIKIIELLLQKNADPKLQDKTERTAYDYCNQETKIAMEQMKKSNQIKDQLKNADDFIPPRPPVARGFIYKTGQMIVTLNERYFVLNPDEGTFIRFKNISDYPLKPLEIIPLRSVRSVSMTQKGFISKSGFYYFELLYSTRIILACKNEHIAKKWVEYIYKATVYYQYIEEKIKEGTLDPNLIDKNIEVQIEDTNVKAPSSDPPPKQLSPEQSISLPRDEATLIQKRLSNPEPAHRYSQSPPRTSEIEQQKSINQSQQQLQSSVLEGQNELLKDSKVTFDSFEIIKELGSGAFGKVFLVKHKADGEIFAMKALKKKTLILKKQIKYAITEANVLKMCKHPFILGLHFAFQTPNYLYLVLDYCQGGDLSYHIANQGKFSEEDARFYAAEIILAIEYLHTKDIIYRDMKPENILLDIQGHVKLADFGLSKENVSDQDKAKSFCGSPAYLSPDILSQKGAGKPSDIYGIGCVMFEMMTGESPYYNDDIQQMYKNIQSGTLKWPKKMSAEAKNLISKMLERDPNKRIGTKSKDEIKQDPFFKGIDWDKVYKRLYKPPITDFSEMHDDDDQQDFDGDELGYNGKAIFQDQDYEQENNRTNRVKNFSFATNSS